MPEGVKINSKTYINFLQKISMPWYKKQALVFKRKAKLLQDEDLNTSPRTSSTRWASKPPV